MGIKEKACFVNFPTEDVLQLLTCCCCRGACHMCYKEKVLHTKSNAAPEKSSRGNMAEGNSEKFDIKIVHDNFLQSLHESDDVSLKFYLASYKELYKFFNLMGTVFGFVSSDLKSKIDILDEFLANEEVADQFRTVKTMMNYEIEETLLTKKDYVSGSRTLLRLHRGLDFIRVFMRSLGEIQGTDKTSSVCQEAYDQTLAHYHPWLIRKGAKMAMYTMPTREQLLRKVCGNTDHEIQRAMDILPKMLEVTTDVYDRIDSLYTVNKLHTLP